MSALFNQPSGGSSATPIEQDDPVALPDEASGARARRRRLQKMRQRSGRASTNLTGRGGQSLGTEFSRTLLG